MILGIDNGISGALVFMTDDGQLGPMSVMPIQKSRKGNELNVFAIWEFIRTTWEYIDPEELVVTIEEPGGSKSASAAASMSGSFHALRALCQVKGLPIHRITPVSWQKKMIPGKAGDTKALALTKARELWPQESFLASPRCTKPHDGLIDAALIAEFTRLHLL